MNGATPRKKILLVDDDLLLRDIYEAVLEQEGFEVIPAGDGQEAWELLGKGILPDVVFTGINMPRLDGFGLIEKMRQDPRFALIPVAISSHKGLPEHEERAKALGVKDFIFQGTTPPLAVVKRIKIILGLKSAFRIAILPHEADGNALISFLNATQGTNCIPQPHENVIIELEPAAGNNDFKIKLVCENEGERL